MVKKKKKKMEFESQRKCTDQPFVSPYKILSLNETKSNNLLISTSPFLLEIRLVPPEQEIAPAQDGPFA